MWKNKAFNFWCVHITINKRSTKCDLIARLLIEITITIIVIIIIIIIIIKIDI